MNSYDKYLTEISEYRLIVVSRSETWRFWTWGLTPFVDHHKDKRTVTAIPSTWQSSPTGKQLQWNPK